MAGLDSKLLFCFVPAVYHPSPRELLILSLFALMHSINFLITPYVILGFIYFFMKGT